MTNGTCSLSWHCASCHTKNRPTLIYCGLCGKQRWTFMPASAAEAVARKIAREGANDY